MEKYKEEEILEYKLNFDENINIDYRNSNFKIIKIYFEELGRYIYLKQDSTVGKGGIFWDCVILLFYFKQSYILTKIFYEIFFHEKKNIEKLNILELGAGTALPSIFLNLINNHNVVITDIKNNIPLIKENLDLNKVTSEFLVEELNWEVEEHSEIIKLKNKKEYDFIIGSDLAYWDELYDCLINVLFKFSSKNTKIILCYKIRSLESIDNFLNKFSVFFDYILIEDSIILKHFPLKNKLKILVGTLKVQIIIKY